MDEKEQKKAAREEAKKQLVADIQKMGYPGELGEAIARQLGGEKAIRRMIAYLHSAKPRSAEEIVDEMLAISAEIGSWIQKKQAEEANAAYNELLWYGLGTEEDED